MVEGRGLHRRGYQYHIALKIRTFVASLPPERPECDKITPKIKFWIDYALDEKFTTVDELSEGVSYVAWGHCSSYTSIARFLKEFRDESKGSEQARSFVDKLCEYILRWFAVASVEKLSPNKYLDLVGGSAKGTDLIGAACLIGSLIERDLLSHELVRQHLVKPLIAHHYTDHDDDERSIRAMAIYNLFVIAKRTLLRGLLDPEDVQACFKILDTKISLNLKVSGPTPERLEKFRDLHATWLKQKEEEQRNIIGVQGLRGEGDKDVIVNEAPAGVETPSVFSPPVFQIPTDIPSISHGIEPPSVSYDVLEPPSHTLTSGRVASIPLATSNISNVFGWVSAESGEDIGGGRVEKMPTRHKTFYSEDGNVEIVCGDTVFRVSSTIISHSSSELREILSPNALLKAPTPEGCPRFGFADSAEDFEVFLKIFYVPGFPPRNKVLEFNEFASLLRIVTKYDFSAVREHLFEDLKGAYPTKWDDFETAKVLGEDVFGSPKPHPNAVLNLFVAENVRFAVPFAAYRASIGGFLALMSSDPGTVLPRHTIAYSIYGMERIRSSTIGAAYAIAHVENRPACVNQTCVLNDGIKSMERRIDAMAKLYGLMIGERNGGMLSPPSFGGIACAECTKVIEGVHATWRSNCWEILLATFSFEKRLDEV